jgi:hypothetical protein
MNGANRKTDPIERSISPATISSTSPAARIANGAKYGSTLTKFACVKKCSVCSEKYSVVSSVTTTMLPSRSVRKRVSISRAPGRWARGSLADASPAGACSGAGLEVLLPLMA